MRYLNNLVNTATMALFTMVLSLLTTSNALAQTGSKPAVPADRGKLVYEQNCLACHQIDGSGVPQLTPTLSNTTFVLGDKARLINIVLKGMKDVEVDGEIYDNPMPPFAALSDEDIASVLTYIRSNFTNKAGVVKKEEVAIVRKGG